MPAIKGNLSLKKLSMTAIISKSMSESKTLKKILLYVEFTTNHMLCHLVMKSLSIKFQKASFCAVESFALSCSNS